MRKYVGPEVPIESTYYRISRFALTAACFWPTLKFTVTIKLLFLLNLSAVAVGAFCENTYGFMNLQMLLSALEAFCPGVTKALSVIKMCIFFVWQKAFARIVNEMYDMIMDGVANERKRGMMQRVSASANFFSFLPFVSGHCTNILFNTRPIIAIFWLWWQEKEMEFPLPFNVVLPDIMERMPLYPVTYLYLTLSGFMTVMTFSGVDGFFLCTCFYFGGLFQWVQYDTEELFKQLKDCEHATWQQNVKIRRQLGSIVERHNRIMDLCNDFSSLFRFIVFMHFISAAVVLCLSILDLLLNTASTEVLLYVAYSTAASCQYLLYCVGGTYLEEQSIGVATTLYNVEWYKCDVSTRKMVLFMLARAQKAQIVDVPFFNPSLISFNALFTKTGSYIALLKTFF